MHKLLFRSVIVGTMILVSAPPATAWENPPGWAFRGWEGLVDAGPGIGSAYRGYGYMGPPGWTPFGFYGGWGFRAPGFSANFAPFVLPPPPLNAEPPGATLIINLPADAVLTIDDRATTQTSEQRTFTSHKLASGYTYYYNLKAEIVRDGQTQIVTKRVPVRVGEVTRVTLEPAETALTSR
jgi:uncharacterized protein (TIGR03000 family)